MTGLCAQVQAACDLTITDEQRRNRQSDKNSIQEGGTRMLKLCLTDGRQQLIGIEYRRLTGLHTDPPHGLKLVLSNVAVRRGVLWPKVDREVLDLRLLVDDELALHQRLLL